MALSEKLDKVDKKLAKTSKQIDDLEQTSIAMEVLKYSKEQNEKSNDHLMIANRRFFVALLVVLVMWFLTIGFGIYYITHYTTEVVEENASTDSGGNACIGDNCNNGDIDYGEGYKKN